MALDRQRKIAEGPESNVQGTLARTFFNRITREFLVPAPDFRDPQAVFDADKPLFSHGEVLTGVEGHYYKVDDTGKLIKRREKFREREATQTAITAAQREKEQIREDRRRIIAEGKKKRAEDRAAGVRALSSPSS